MYLYMLCCVSCLPSPNTHIHKEAAFGRLHNSGAGGFGARPSCGFLYGWVCGGWGGVRWLRGVPRCAGITNRQHDIQNKYIV